MRANDPGVTLTVAVTYPGDPTDPQSWSGTPAGLIRGLEAAGVRVVPVDLTPPSTAARVWTRVTAQRLRPTADELLTLGRESAAYARLVELTALYRVPRHVDAVLQIGTGYRVHHRRLATFEDMTIAQAVEHAWGPFPDLPPALVDGRRRLQQSVYEKAGICFAATSWVADSISDDYGIPREWITVTGLGVNREGQPSTDKDWSSPRFLFVGHDWERKRGDAVVKAFAQVRDLYPDALLHLVGAGVPDIDADGVVVHGPLPISEPAAQQRLGRLFAEATCLVVPSRLEPAGIVYAEAGRMGIPSIGTTVGGAADMIGDGGIVVDPSDLGGVSEAMLRLADPAVAKESGRRASQHAARMTWEAVGARVRDRLVRAVISGRGPDAR